MIIGRPVSSQTVWSLEFSPPLVRLQMRRVDHDPLRLGPFPGKAGEDAQARVKAVVEVAPDGTIHVLIGENASNQKQRPQVEIEEAEEIVL